MELFLTNRGTPPRALVGEESDEIRLKFRNIVGYYGKTSEGLW